MNEIHERGDIEKVADDGTQELPTRKDMVLSIGDPEVRKALLTKTTEPKSLRDPLSECSSWSRCTKAVAGLQRQAKKIRSHAPFSVSEQESAEHFILCMPMGRK